MVPFVAHKQKQSVTQNVGSLKCAQCARETFLLHASLFSRPYKRAALRCLPPSRLHLSLVTLIRCETSGFFFVDLIAIVSFMHCQLASPEEAVPAAFSAVECQPTQMLAVLFLRRHVRLGRLPTAATAEQKLTIDSIRHIVSVGCAPTPIQYFVRVTSSWMSLCAFWSGAPDGVFPAPSYASCCGLGLYVPNTSMGRLLRAVRACVTTML